MCAGTDVLWVGITAARDGVVVSGERVALCAVSDMSRAGVDAARARIGIRRVGVETPCDDLDGEATSRDSAGLGGGVDASRVRVVPDGGALGAGCVRNLNADGVPWDAVII